MKIKTNDLNGKALDWAVAKAQGFIVQIRANHIQAWVKESSDSSHEKSPVLVNYRPSTNWSQGGPLIERECIDTAAFGASSEQPKNPDYWSAKIYLHDEIVEAFGPTPLVAAMRCFVLSLLGEEVEIHDEINVNA